MSKEHFLAEKAAIESISDERAIYPNIPIHVTLQEAEDLYAWCLADKDILVRIGLDWSIVENLPVRTGALRYIQSEWQKEFKSMEQARLEWKAQSPKAYELRDELLHHFYFAFYSLPELYKRTQSIAKGNTHAGMIQDLSDLAVLGKANSKTLSAAGMDLTLLDKAEVLAVQMASMFANSNCKKLEGKKLRILRDKAYTHMKETVDEIRRCGQFIFWRDDQRRKGYISQYYKQHTTKASRTTGSKSDEQDIA